jgi:hypothetical protein
MSGQFIFIAGVLGIGGYVGYTVMNHDRAVFAGSKEQIQSELARAETVLPRKTGDGNIRIWSAGRTSKGVALAMQYSPTAPILRCDAVIEAVAADESRVTAQCESPSSSNPAIAKAAKGSAIAQTTHALQSPMFEEHIYSVLRKQPFNRDMVDSKQVGMVMGNMGAMQREALQTHDEMQRMANGN